MLFWKEESLYVFNTLKKDNTAFVQNTNKYMKEKEKNSLFLSSFTAVYSQPSLGPQAAPNAAQWVSCA